MFFRSSVRPFSFIRIKKYVHPSVSFIFIPKTRKRIRKRRTAIALDHAATPAQFPAVGVDVWEVVVVVVFDVDVDDEVFDEEVVVLEEEEVVVVGAEAPPVSAFFAETSYRPFANQT